MTKNAIGTDRQTLQLNGKTWLLDEHEAGSVEVFLTELRKARDWRHQPWCDPQQHEMHAEGAGMDESPCVGRVLTVSDEIAGWWHQDDVGTQPRFYVDRDLRVGPSWDAPVDDVEVVASLLPEDSPAHQLLTRALAELDGGEQ